MKADDYRIIPCENYTLVTKSLDIRRHPKRCSDLISLQVRGGYACRMHRMEAEFSRLMTLVVLETTTYIVKAQRLFTLDRGANSWRTPT